MEHPRKIKAVVFDYGGVIELFEGDDVRLDIADYLGIPYSTFQQAYYQRNHLANVENMKWEDLLLQVASVFTSDEAKKEGLKETMRLKELNRNLNAELLSFFPQLKKLGLTTGIFSNSNSSLRERLKEFGLLNLADVLVISGEIGYQKPHKKAFQVLFEKLRLLPEEVVFVDDTEKSLEKADEIGYIPILFKDNGQLKVELQKLGISLN